MSSQKIPLQRTASSSPYGVSAAIHIFGLASFAYSFKYLVDYPNPINDSFGWHFQYLTIIGLAFATATFLAGITADITSSPALFRIKNYLSMCTTPLEVLISVLYWSLRAIDRSLVLPEWVELPLSADLGFHAIPSIVLVADLLLLSPPWTISAPQAMGLSTTLAFAYWFWIEYCFTYNQFYPYPIFEMVGTLGRIGLFTMSAVVMTGSTVALKELYAAVNGSEDHRGGETERGKALDEGSTAEALGAYVRQGTYMAKGQVESL